MDQYMDQLKTYIASHPLKYTGSDAQTLMEMLYYFYTDGNAVESDQFLDGIETVMRLTQHLPFK